MPIYMSLETELQVDDTDQEEEKSIEDDYSTEEDGPCSVLSPNSQEKDEALRVSSSASRSSVSGFRFSVSGSRSSVSGYRSSVSDSRSSIFGSRSCVFGSRTSVVVVCRDQVRRQVSQGFHCREAKRTN